MASIVSTNTRSRQHDHFEPEAAMDPQEQRKLRGHLEQIDFAAFAANREVIGKTLGQADLARFQRLAVAAAQARAHWVKAAIETSPAQALGAEEIENLTRLRRSYEELADAYEALRRMVERGYLSFQTKD
ncbi:MAG: hypothetical protein GC155_03450 [Alphaproteobacteria bacterium]|nr:hypothetical protein [Alphaproteobacteria bacterium]